MAQELIISISGMRGIVGQNLTPRIAAEFGSAFGTFLKNDAPGNDKLTVCIGRDSRPSGQELASAVIRGLCSVGIDVVDLGLVTTPCVGIMLRHLKCNGGVVVTASHNPLEYNGIKLLLDNGIAPPKASAEKIKKIFLDKKFTAVDSADLGNSTPDDRACDVHIDKVMTIIDSGAIAAKKFKVVLDSVNGAGGPITKKFLELLGCQVLCLNSEPTGLFAHTPEPTRENLTGLCDRIKTADADIGFALDPDADRLAIIDESGNYIGEEYSLALAAKYIFSTKTGSAAANLSTSRMIDDIAAKAGSSIIRTPVGEANVAEAMLKNDCIIGGEGNGGVIDLRVGPVRDSLVAMALVLQLMTDTGKSLSALVAEIGGYYIHKSKVNADKTQADAIIEKAKQIFKNAKINTADGCRFDFDDGWLHLRTSNTEPVMRLILETKNKQAARGYIDTITELCEGVLE